MKLLLLTWERYARLSRQRCNPQELPEHRAAKSSVVKVVFVLPTWIVVYIEDTSSTVAHTKYHYHAKYPFHEPSSSDTHQRQNTEISKQIFPEKEYRGLSPNFHIHDSVSDLYIPTIGLPILLKEICIPILGLYKSLTDTCMLKLGLRPLYSQKRNI